MNILTIRELISWLVSQDPHRKIDFGFAAPLTKAGGSDYLVFSSRDEAKLSDMLNYAKSALKMIEQRAQAQGLEASHDAKVMIGDITGVIEPVTEDHLLSWSIPAAGFSCNPIRINTRSDSPVIASQSFVSCTLDKRAEMPAETQWREFAESGGFPERLPIKSRGPRNRSPRPRRHAIPTVRNAHAQTQVFECEFWEFAGFPEGREIMGMGR